MAIWHSGTGEHGGLERFSFAHKPSERERRTDNHDRGYARIDLFVKSNYSAHWSNKRTSGDSSELWRKHDDGNHHAFEHDDENDDREWRGLSK